MSVINDSCPLDTANTASDKLSTLPQILWQCLQHTAASLDQEINNIHWVVAYSGGKDSSALAHAFSQLNHRPCKVTLAHIHHGLQSEADQWMEHAKGFAEQLGFAFYAQKVKVEQGTRQSLEANAREARYKALRDFCYAQKAVLLLAQHADDQLETMLLQLKRGAGPKGLAAMAERQTKHKVVQIRPWLACTQQSINDYVTQHCVAHIHDPSNDSLQFDRNFLRQQVIPLLTQRWPSLAKSAVRSAHLCAQQASLIEQQVASWMAQHQLSNNTLPLAPLLSLPLAWQAETLRYWCQQQSVGLPTQAQLNGFLDDLHCSEDKQPQLQFNDCILRRYARHLYLQTKALANLSEAEKNAQNVVLGEALQLESLALQVLMSEQCSEQIDEKALFRCALATDDTVVIKPIGADMRVRLNHNHSVKGKKLLKQYQIPPWLRRHTLGLFCDHGLLALLTQLGVTAVKDTAVSTRDNRAYLVVLPDIKPYQHV